MHGLFIFDDIEKVWLEHGAGQMKNLFPVKVPFDLVFLNFIQGARGTRRNLTSTIYGRHCHLKCSRII